MCNGGKIEIYLIIYCYIKNKKIFLWYLLAKIIGCHFPNLRAIAQDVLSKAH